MQIIELALIIYLIYIWHIFIKQSFLSECEVMLLVLTNCAALLEDKLHWSLPVLHPEVYHARLALYNVSGRRADGTKCWSGGRWRRGGGRWRGRGWTRTSCCCVGCFWVAGGSVHGGLARLAGKVTAQRSQFTDTVIYSVKFI